MCNKIAEIGKIYAFSVHKWPHQYSWKKYWKKYSTVIVGVGD